MSKSLINLWNLYCSSIVSFFTVVIHVCISIIVNIVFIVELVKLFKYKKQ